MGSRRTQPLCFAGPRPGALFCRAPTPEAVRDVAARRTVLLMGVGHVLSFAGASFSSDRSLAATLQRRGLTNPEIADLARMLAGFHAGSQRVSGPEYEAHRVEHE